MVSVLLLMMQTLREETKAELRRQKSCTDRERTLAEQVKEQLRQSTLNLQVFADKKRISDLWL